MMDRALIVIVVVMLVTTTTVTFARRMNVLFLMADDLRPEIGAYGARYMHTPNLDALASRSLLMRRTYVQQAVCSPSRTSLLTGRRPDTTHVHDLMHYFRDVGGNFTTLPQYMKEHGYRTAGVGKIFHPGRASGGDDPVSWTEPYFHAHDDPHWASDRHESWYAADDKTVQEYPLQDQLLARHAVQTLRRLAPGASADQPFFLAVGFHRPHLPFLFPARFLGAYPASIPLADNPYAPVGMPEIAWSNYDELRSYRDIGTRFGYGAINSTLPREQQRQLRRAYYASVSYIDDLIGSLLQELDSLGLSNNTVVSFVGDHGWQLGEHAEWCKHTNFELATRVPFLLSVPGQTNRGVTTDALVELVDLFPTIVNVSGAGPVPPLCPPQSSNVTLCVEGVSLSPLIHAPNMTWKSSAFSQYPRMAVSGNKYMGYSLRDRRYRYTEWPIYLGWPTWSPLWSKPYPRGHVELYDHQTDPDENVNLAGKPAYSDVQRTLAKRLREGWRAALPATQYEYFNVEPLH